MMDKANALKLNITNLASTSHGNQKSICERCIEDFKIAEKELVLAKNALHEHKYGEAGSYVDKALSFGVTCRTDLKSYHDKVPSDVFRDMKIFVELYKAAFAIILKI
uniref:Pectinesterase inhibitor domain-containing protein n=2 Tax=Cajanus cajan TaxID=3821 RepID=A0A151SAS9_CAJCA|nr:hypothetical protein KK1_026269 [Cajanus cajan]